MTSVNYSIQIKDITFIKNYVKQLIESIYKATVNELFNAVYSEVQIHQFISKIYKIVFNFKIVLKLTKDVAASRLTTIFDSRLIFQDFSNLVHQICFEVLIYYNSTNKIILISIELAHLFFVSVLRVYFFQLLSIISSSHSIFSSLTVMFIDVIISSIFTSAAFRYSFFISSIFMISFIFAFKKIYFVIFCFCIHFEKKNH